MLNTNQSFHGVCKSLIFKILHCFIPVSLLINLNRVPLKMTIYKELENWNIISIIGLNIITFFGGEKKLNSNTILSERRLV